MTLAAGTRLGPYEIVAPLGAGGMGEVYRARDTRLEREMAIKVLPEAVSFDPERLKRFEKEAKSASALNHPNIVTIHDIGSEGGVSYIAMELVEGGTLRELMASGPLSVKKLLQIAPQIAEGLARAHEAGIVHRDLKPENVMVKKDGLVKILDFGLAKLSSTGSGSAEGSLLPTMTGTQPGVVVGTVGYMSPEQASGETVGFRSDQFSLGSILYEMCTGKRAFQRKTAIDTLAAILNEEPEPITSINPQVPAPLRWIVERCLSKEPRERYAATDDLSRDLATLRDHASEGFSAPGSLSLTAAPGIGALRSRRLWFLLGAVALTTATVCGLAAWFALAKAASRPPPSFRQLTFRRGHILSARFSSDAHTIVYSAAWNGNPMEIFVGRPESPESRPFGLPGAEVLAISGSGEMAVSLDRVTAGTYRRTGTLAQVSVAGGAAPRHVLKEIEWADWSPDGKSLAIVRVAPGKMRLEYPAGKVLYETSGWVSHPRVSAQGDQVAFIDHPVPNDDGGSVAMVDRSGRVTKLSEHFSSVLGLAWAPNGEVWFTASRVGLIRSLHSTTRGGRVRERIRVPGSLTLQDISRDFRLLVTRDTVRNEMVALPPGQSKERDLSWLDYSIPIAISGDGRTILFSETGEGGGAGYSVYIRSTDGSSAVRLGEGMAQDLSADGEWALAIVASAQQIVAYPTGAGEPKVLSKKGLSPTEAKFTPDGRQVVLTAGEAGHGTRVYLWSVDGSEPRALTPEGYGGGWLVAPDGKWTVVTGPDQKVYVYPLSGGKPTEVPGLDRDNLDQRSLDGRFVYVHRSGEMPAKVFRLNLSTGQKDLWRTLMPADAAGVSEIRLLPTPGGEAYVYGFERILSELYLVGGLK